MKKYVSSTLLANIQLYNIVLSTIVTLYYLWFSNLGGEYVGWDIVGQNTSSLTSNGSLNCPLPCFFSAMAYGMKMTSLRVAPARKNQMMSCPSVVAEGLPLILWNPSTWPHPRSQCTCPSLSSRQLYGGNALATAPRYHLDPAFLQLGPKEVSIMWCPWAGITPWGVSFSWCQWVWGRGVCWVLPRRQILWCEKKVIWNQTDPSLNPDSAVCDLRQSHRCSNVWFLPRTGISDNCEEWPAHCVVPGATLLGTWQF